MVYNRSERVPLYRCLTTHISTNIVFLNAMPCSLVDRYQFIAGASSQYLANRLKMEATSSSETLLPIYQTPLHKIPEDVILLAFTAVIVFRRFSARISVRKPTTITGFRGFIQSFQGNAVIVTSIWPGPPPPTVYPIYYVLFVLSFDALHFWAISRVVKYISNE
jgi:hypothetical protein